MRCLWLAMPPPQSQEEEFVAWNAPFPPSQSQDEDVVAWNTPSLSTVSGWGVCVSECPPSQSLDEEFVSRNAPLHSLWMRSLCLGMPPFTVSGWGVWVSKCSPSQSLDEEFESRNAALHSLWMRSLWLGMLPPLPSPSQSQGAGPSGRADGWEREILACERQAGARKNPRRWLQVVLAAVLIHQGQRLAVLAAVFFHQRQRLAVLATVCKLPPTLATSCAGNIFHQR